MAKGRLEWRTCSEIYSKEEEANPDDNTNYKLRCIQLTKAKIENEVREICKQQYVIAKHFIEKSEIAQKAVDSRIFYLKTMADSFRYLVPFEQDQGKLAKLREQCELRYKEAVDESVDIEWTNPLRLAVYLNYTVYLAEVKLDFKEAIA